MRKRRPAYSIGNCRQSESSRDHALTNHRTDFWGPASNFGIPIAAVADMSKDPEMYVPDPYNHTQLLLPLCFTQPRPFHPESQANPTLSNSISGRMTAALSVYSAVFMRYSMAVTPKNYLLFGCHFINCSSQLVQGYRYLNYWNWGGRETALEAAKKGDGETAIKKVGELVKGEK